MVKNTNQLPVYRQMTPAQRVSAGCCLHDFAHHRLVVHMSRQHPDKTEREVLVAVAKRLLGDAAGVL
jgi:hypothetical protein